MNIKNLLKVSFRVYKGIQKFAESLGASDKFHDKLTTIFSCLIKSRFQKNEFFEKFIKTTKDVVENAMSIIEMYYSPGLLFSKEARGKLVSPIENHFQKSLKNNLD